MKEKTMYDVPRKKWMEKDKEKTAFYMIKGIGSDRLSVPTLDATVLFSTSLET